MLINKIYEIYKPLKNDLRKQLYPFIENFEKEKKVKEVFDSFDKENSVMKQENDYFKGLFKISLIFNIIFLIRMIFN